MNCAGPKAGAASAPALAERLFARLGDGRFHSGQALAREFGVTRSAVWKAVATLRERGAEIHAVPNRGYRLAIATAPLDARVIAKNLSREASRAVGALEVLWSTPSTNALLLDRKPAPPGRAEVVLAEHQTQGRGRRGRAWLAPLGGAICLSIGWTFARLPPDIGSLSLVIGLCVRRALRELAERESARGRAAPADIRIKWPNDLVVAESKLGGILIELRAEGTGPAQVVIGIGINVALGAEAMRKVAATGTHPATLASLGIDASRRNEIAARVIEHSVRGVQEFEREGFAAFMDEWHEADALKGCAIVASSPGERIRGTARGVDRSGALLLETPAGLRKVIAGEVTLRTGEA